MIDKQLFRRMPEETEEDYKIRMGGLRNTYKLTWTDIAVIINDELGYNYSESKYRKEYNLYLRGREDAQDEMPVSMTPSIEKKDNEYYTFSENETEMRDRYQTSTENTPYYRLMRQDARFERFYRLIAQEIKRLPAPDFLGEEIDHTDSEGHEFLMTLADLHIGACFEAVNNSYSMTIAKQRFEKLLGKTRKFVSDHGIETLKILSLGDIVQGILRISDLKLNEAPVVDALVYAMRLLADFLNKLSQSCFIEFYQVLFSNHDQLRPLGTKASELGAEDMGKILYAYLEDTLANNPRIKIIGDAQHDYLEFSIFDFDCIAMHGHQIKDLVNVQKDLASRHRKFFDYVFLGHTHSAKEFITSTGKHHNMEVLISSSIVGEDPYANKLMVGSKASAKIFEFDPEEGHVASYNLILN